MTPVVLTRMGHLRLKLWGTHLSRARGCKASFGRCIAPCRWATRGPASKGGVKGLISWAGPQRVWDPGLVSRDRRPDTMERRAGGETLGACWVIDASSMAN